MVEKPNLTMEAEQRLDILGASNGSAGLSALDLERQASMADEGGASGASMEFQSDASMRTDMESGFKTMQNRWTDLFQSQRVGFFLGVVAGITGTLLLVRERREFQEGVELGSGERIREERGRRAA